MVPVKDLQTATLAAAQPGERTRGHSGPVARAPNGRLWNGSARLPTVTSAPAPMPTRQDVSRARGARSTWPQLPPRLKRTPSRPLVREARATVGHQPRPPRPLPWRTLRTPYSWGQGVRASKLASPVARRRTQFGLDGKATSRHTGMGTRQPLSRDSGISRSSSGIATAPPPRRWCNGSRSWEIVRFPL